MGLRSVLVLRFSNHNVLGKSQLEVPAWKDTEGQRQLLMFGSSFRGGWEVQKGHFRFGLSLTKCNMAAKRIYLSIKVTCGRICTGTKR